MPAITTKHFTLLNGQESELMKKFPAEAHLPIDDFLSLFWDEDERAAVAAVHKLIDHNSVKESFRATLTIANVPLSDTMPIVSGPRDFGGVDIRVRMVSYASTLYPNVAKGIRPFASHAGKMMFQNAINDIMDAALVRGYITRIFQIYRECTTHEAMRYIFPPTLYILRCAGLDDIASQIETIKRMPSKLPPLTPYDRQVLRYMNDWFATQTLLGTLEGNGRVDVGMENYVRVKLEDDVYLLSDDDSEKTLVRA